MRPLPSVKNKSITALMLILVVLVSGLLAGKLLLTQAEATTSPLDIHNLDYTQIELAEMLTNSIRENSQLDLTIVQPSRERWYSTLGNPSETDQFSSLQDSFIKEQIANSYLLETIIQPDGCVLYLGFDTEEHMLVALALNFSNQVHDWQLSIEQRNEINTQLQLYQMNYQIDASSEDLLPQISTYAIEEISTEIKAYTSDGIQLSVPPEGIGIIRCQTGLLYGGRVPEISQQRNPINSVTFKFGPQIPATNADGLVRIYSYVDNPGTALQGLNYLTYSASNHSIFYEFDERSAISITPNGFNQFFTIELHNSQPVSLETINSLLGSLETNKLVINAMNPGAELIVTNPSGNAIDFIGMTTFSGNGIARLSGRMYGVLTRSSLFGVIEVLNNFTLYATGGSGGVNTKNSLKVSAGILDATCTTAAGIPISVTDMSITNASTVTANGNNIVARAILVNNELYADGLSLVKGYNAATGISSGSIVTKDGSDSYANAKAESDQTKTRVVGLGSVTGINTSTLAGRGLYVGAGTVILAEGNLTGMKAVFFQSGDLSANSATNRPSLTSNLESKKKGTIIATGTGVSSIGFDATSTVATTIEIFHGTRIVATGSTYGFYADNRSNAVFYHPYYHSQIIALGGEAGIYLSNTIAGTTLRLWASYLTCIEGGAVYARGGTYGIRVSSGCVEAFNLLNHSDPAFASSGPTIIGIGGVDNSSMPTNNPLSNWDSLREYSFDFKDLPKPIVDEKGLLPYKAGSYGIWVQCYGYIASYDMYTEVYAYGGEYGASTVNAATETNQTGTYIVSYEGGYLEMHGGSYGGSAQTYMYCWSFHGTSGDNQHDTYGDSILKGYGKKIGLQSNSFITAYTGLFGDLAGYSYIYGYGEETGIYAATDVWAPGGSIIIGETLLDVSAEETDPKAKRAIISQNNMYTVHTDGANLGILQEIYNVSNLNITSNPYALNSQLPAIKAALGSDPNILLNFDWTTPLSHPSIQTDRRDFSDYDPTDDQKLIKANTINNQTGLIAYGDTKNITLVGNSVGGSYLQTNSLIKNGQYRIVFRGVNSQDLRTMNVSLDLYENFLDTKTALTDLPTSTAYELVFVSPDATEQTQRILLDQTNSNFNLVTGKITLFKLRMGDYYLTPKVDIGYPYSSLPTIHFKTLTDNTVEVPPDQAANYERYWYEKVIFVGADAVSGDQSVYGETVVTSEIILNNSSDNPASFPLIRPEYDLPAKRFGQINLYYYRLRYSGENGLDFTLTDKESGELLPGSFSVRPTKDGVSIPGLADFTITNTGSLDNPVWSPVTVYAGLEYEFSQQSSAISGYILAPHSYKVRLGFDGTNYKLTELTPNSNYSSQTSSTNSYYSIRVQNDQPYILIPLYVLAQKSFDEGDMTNYLTQTDFSLSAQYRNGTYATISSEALSKNTDGTFIMKLKPNRLNFSLRQTVENPGYLARKITYHFTVSDILYAADGQSITSYRIKLESYTPDPGEDIREGIGWAAPVLSGQAVDYYQKIYLTNVPLPRGSITIEVNATGLWAGHDDAIFLIKLQGRDTANAEKIYYTYVNLRGSNDIEHYKTQVTSGLVTLSNLPFGNYTLKVYSALRTDEQPVQLVQVSQASTGATFHFTCDNEAYLSGGAAITNEFIIDFSG